MPKTTNAVAVLITRRVPRPAAERAVLKRAATASLEALLDRLSARLADCSAG